MAYPIVETAQEKMDKQVALFKEELNTVRTGMANAAMLNGIDVDYYGSPSPINQIAGVKIEEGRTLVIKPYDPSSLKEIEKALNKANLGIAPQNDGNVIRLTVPQLTGEVRKEMTKKVSRLAEDAKIQIRNIRRDAMTVIKKNKTVDEDTQKDMEEEVQKLTDRYVEQISALAEKKNEEVLTV